MTDTFDEDQDVGNGTATAMSKTGSVGTPLYMPPECFFKKDPSSSKNAREQKAEWEGYNPKQMDAFAIGVTLYQLTHDGEYHQEFSKGNPLKMAQDFDGEVKVNDYVTPFFKWVITRLLDPDPESRMTVSTLALVLGG